MDTVCVGVDGCPVFVVLRVMRLSAGLESLLREVRSMDFVS